MRYETYEDAQERELYESERRRIDVAEMIEREFVDAWIDGTYSKPVMAAVRFKSPGVGFYLGERKFADVFSEMLGTIEETQLAMLDTLAEVAKGRDSQKQAIELIHAMAAQHASETLEYVRIE
jgi:hypothetical protein